MHGNSNHRVTSEKYVWKIRVRTEAHIDEWLEDYFGGLYIGHKKDGTSTLTGSLTDMSAVYGLIVKLRDSGIYLVSLQVERMPMEVEECRGSIQEP